jgi:hypothetical protein
VSMMPAAPYQQVVENREHRQVVHPLVHRMDRSLCAFRQPRLPPSLGSLPRRLCRII